MSSSVVQATEHIIVESATAVVTQVAKSAASDLKSIESNVAKEAVSASDEAPASIVEKLEDGVQVVAAEAMKGAKSAVEAVEQHPELIAEGVLAVAVGVASLVQPELAAGEIAIIGKMAADSAKKTVTTIASDTGSQVVKAIAKDISDDAVKEAAKDVADKAAKAKTEGEEKGEASIPNATDQKVEPVESVKDVPNGNTLGSSDAKTVPGSVAAPGDKTIAIEVAQEPSQANANSSDAKSDPSTAAPVELKITLGADGSVKAVSNTAGEDKNKVEEASKGTEQVALKTSSVETTTKASVVSNDVPKDQSEVAEKLPTIAPSKPEGTASAQDASTQDKSITPDAPIPSTVAAIATITSTTKTNTISETTTENPVATIEGEMITISSESLQQLHQKLDAMHEAIQQITKVLALHLPPPATVPGDSISKSLAGTSETVVETIAAAISLPVAEPLPQTNGDNTATSQGQTVDPAASAQSPLKRPTPEKRTSMLGAIGKVFWPFGSSDGNKVAVVTVTDVTNGVEVVA